MSTPEGLIQKSCCEYLSKQGYFFFRTNNQPVYDKKLNSGYGGYRGQGKWAQPGLADILLLKDGVLYALEIKAKTKQSADQLLFAKRLTRHGGIYHIICSLDEIKALFP